MTRPLRIHEAADAELNEAADYYDLESPGLGEAFLEDIEKGFQRIREHSDAATAVAPGIRKLVLTRFPFAIIYTSRADTVRVLAIAHQRKRPYYWRGRAARADRSKFERAMGKVPDAEPGGQDV